MIKNRACQVTQLLDECQLDALLFVRPANLRYLCGFSGSDGALLVTRDASCFLTDSRYTGQARLQVTADRITEYAVKIDGIAGAAAELGGKRIGFESEYLTYAFVERLRGKSGAEVDWQPVAKPLAGLRGVKDVTEVAALEAATAIAAASFEEILPLLRPGVTEREIALTLEFAMRRRGGEEKSFDLIVASGERGALPHGVASERRLAAGELVTIDFGVRCAGYHSDETVTVAIGEVTAELQSIYETTLIAHDLAIAALRPGRALREVDAVARDYITARGYGDYFGHGLGHGVGLEVHEAPTLSPRSDDVAREGMVVTIEPGIYLPGRGGVRIEDMLLVTADGCRPLTRIPKNFRTLPV